MRVEDVPGCCTAKMIVDFGVGLDVMGLVNEIVRMCNSIKANGNACALACTTSNQKAANKALRICGFTRSRWMSKKRHSETKLAVWTKVLEDTNVHPHL